MKIGVIGDDFTGSADIANTLARAGARTVQYVGTPTEKRWLHVRERFIKGVGEWW